MNVGGMLVYPASKPAGAAMRHWSYEWCVSDDECEVAP